MTSIPYKVPYHIIQNSSVDGKLKEEWKSRPGLSLPTNLSSFSHILAAKTSRICLFQNSPADSTPKLKMTSFFAIHKHFSNMLNIKLELLLFPVTWESRSCGLNNVLLTKAMTAEVWRDRWGFLQP